MASQQRKLARDQLVAITAEEARRQRAEMRRSYGNKFSSINLNRMQRQRQTVASVTNANTASGLDSRKDITASAATPPSAAVARLPYRAPTPLYAPNEVPLRRIASSFAHVRDLHTGSCAALPPEDSEEDAREERAEVLIRSQTMPMAPIDASTLLYPSAKSPTDPDPEQVPMPAQIKLPKTIPDLQMESRATERWQQLGSTVSALFRARRYINSKESPVAQTRRLREQRELLEAFTRPFLYEASKRH
ncbi:uncharacterized protein [Drosophila bipectinata]|uniref:uncharacterized protein n=1 Tax=Drosophila bipectinata TaxID=42026 RepID=UPI001C8912E1|nr:uncharacterized protein LOC108129043 [Drosophila bipectinata]